MQLCDRTNLKFELWNIYLYMLSIKHCFQLQPLCFLWGKYFHLLTHFKFLGILLHTKQNLPCCRSVCIRDKRHLLCCYSQFYSNLLYAIKTYCEYVVIITQKHVVKTSHKNNHCLKNRLISFCKGACLGVLFKKGNWAIWVILDVPKKKVKFTIMHSIAILSIFTTSENKIISQANQHEWIWPGRVSDIIFS